MIDLIRESIILGLIGSFGATIAILAYRIISEAIR